jgi:hypothetical protein
MRPSYFYSSAAVISLVLNAICSVSSANTSTTPLYSGLESCLSRDVSKTPQFLPYKLTMKGPNAFPPFSEQFEIYDSSGKQLSEEGQGPLLRELFPGKHFVSLPPGTEINTQSGRSQWDYPVGTVFIHEVDLESGELFELRFLKRMEDHWAFGVYEPASAQSVCAGQLQLRTDDEYAPEMQKEIQLSNSSQGVLRIRYTPIEPESCLSCHSSESNEPLIGPCHFQPNPNVPFVQANVPAWISRFKKQFGYSPIGS